MRIGNRGVCTDEAGGGGGACFPGVLAPTWGGYLLLRPFTLVLKGEVLLYGEGRGVGAGGIGSEAPLK